MKHLWNNMSLQCTIRWVYWHFNTTMLCHLIFVYHFYQRRILSLWASFYQLQPISSNFTWWLEKFATLLMSWKTPILRKISCFYTSVKMVHSSLWLFTFKFGFGNYSILDRCQSWKKSFIYTKISFCSNHHFLLRRSPSQCALWKRTSWAIKYLSVVKESS